MNLVCFSHLRWGFVYQRPQHLLSRFAREYTVFYIEEPMFGAEADCLVLTLTEEHVQVVVPNLRGEADDTVEGRMMVLLDDFFLENDPARSIFWYYTPMALPFTQHYNPRIVVYDCMDELSAFKFAPPMLSELEEELLAKADIVFTGGHSLYEAKKHLHNNIHAFPSSIDKAHFGKARNAGIDPGDQFDIPHPRLGFSISTGTGCTGLSCYGVYGDILFSNYCRPLIILKTIRNIFRLSTAAASRYSFA
jgi:hypothetical protein